MGSGARVSRGGPGRGRSALTSPLRPQKCLRLDPAAPVWAAKQRVLCALNHSLQDALNYGLFQPPSRGRAGKFLDEERLLQDYPPNLDTPLPYLEVRESAQGATAELRDLRGEGRGHGREELVQKRWGAVCRRGAPGPRAAGAVGALSRSAQSSVRSERRGICGLICSPPRRGVCEGRPKPSSFAGPFMSPWSAGSGLGI